MTSGIKFLEILVEKFQYAKNFLHMPCFFYDETPMQIYFYLL